MPFAVFRQHQKKLLVVCGILAMIGFVLSDTLSTWSRNSARAERDLVVADLFGKQIRRSDLGQMNEQRQRANRFMYELTYDPTFFGGVTPTELIDGLILEHEADRLSIPSTAEFARRWIERQTNGGMTVARFESILAKFDQKIGGEQLLLDLASQIRIALARQEIALPIITPLDVFRNYRDQSERTSFKVVKFLVESFVGQVGEPTESEILDLYEKYKDVLPDPRSPTPGFKVPRQVKVEFLGVDAHEVAKKIRAKLSEDEIKAYYEAHKTEYPMDGELPVDLFLGAPELTPPRYLPFSVQRDSMADALAREKANEEIQEMFATIRDEIVDKFSDMYHGIEADIADAKKEGASTESYLLPKPDDLSGVARKHGLSHEVTPLIDRREAELYGRISNARSGTGQSSDARKFAAVAFDPKTPLYDGFELGDSFGDRYLARKIVDSPAHVVDLKEVREQVVRAWKIDKARPLAEKAAADLAAKLKSQGGEIKDLTLETRPVITIEAVTKLKPGMPIPSRFPGLEPMQRRPATLTDLPQIPDASPELIDTLFALKAGEVAVQPDLPRTNYYTMTLAHRDPVTYASLLGPGGALASYWSETQGDIMRKSYTEGMARLREQAGYKPGDYPTGEKISDDSGE